MKKDELVAKSGCKFSFIVKQQTEGFEPSPPVSSDYYYMQIIDSTTFIYRVEGAIEFGLDSPVEESDEKNDEST